MTKPIKISWMSWKRTGGKKKKKRFLSGRKSLKQKEEWFTTQKRVLGTWGEKELNSMVILPGRRKNFQEEANLEMFRAEMKGCFGEYYRKNCNKWGEQESNLEKDEKEGLKNLKKRFKEGEIIILPTDKSGRFGIMSLENYLKAGWKHTIKDEEVDLNIISNTQKELNGNMSMIIKFCRMGHIWNQVDRVRSTMINGSLSLCPMYLTYKDHKG